LGKKQPRDKGHGEDNAMDGGWPALKIEKINGESPEWLRLVEEVEYSVWASHLPETPKGLKGVPTEKSERHANQASRPIPARVPTEPKGSRVKGPPPGIGNRPGMLSKRIGGASAQGERESPYPAKSLKTPCGNIGAKEEALNKRSVEKDD